MRGIPLVQRQSVQPVLYSEEGGVFDAKNDSEDEDEDERKSIEQKVIYVMLRII